MPLRLLFSSSSTSFLSPFRPSLPLATSLLRATFRSRSLSTVLSASNRRRPGGQQSAPNFIRKNRTFRYRDKEDSVMEESNSNSNFNKKRAEGRDKNDFPKKELQLKKRPRANPTSTISFVQILGTGLDTQDTSPSVLLFFDHQRFIFNAGEGLQRFCTEHRIRLSKIDHIFLSRVCSETSGGLPGLLLTLAGMGDEGQSVNVWGPSDLKFLVDAMKSFIPNAAMVHSKSFGPAPSSMTTLPELDLFKSPIILVEDDVVKISAILLWPENTDINHSDQRASEVDDDEFSETLGEKVTTGSKMKLGDISVVYVCELAELKGKFRPEKAKDIYGIRPGPAYRELQLGTPVFSNKLKRLIEPNEVMDPSIPGPIVLLVDCPTFSHFQKLLSSDSLSNYYVDYSGEETPKVVTLVIHLSPSSVISSNDYQRWMKRFGSAQHVIAGHEMKNREIPILRASARISARLNYLCPQYFPAPGFWSLNQSALPDTASTSNTSLETGERIYAENLLKFILRPRDKIGFDRQLVPNLMTPSIVLDDLLSEIPEIVEAADDVRQLWDDTEGENDFMQEEPWLSENRVPNCLENVRRDDLEIVLLGTGSSQPSKYRNVTSIYINLFDKGGLLLDCGEGTLGQMKRRYGVEGADDAIRRLRCIWISHIHADHHAGLARILTQRRDLLKGYPHEPILVVGPRQLKRYLDAYQRLEHLEMIFLDCRHTTETSLKAFQELSQSGSPPISSNGSSLFTGGAPMQSILKRPGVPTDMSVAIPFLHRLNKMLSESGLEALVSFPVVHCPQAFGVLLKASERVNSVGKVIEGWKVVYSGDTRPCPELTEASRGATVLIHEATFEDGMVDEAIARNHSTTEEAIQVGAAAGVYRIILTHFSQRYPKIPVFDEQHMHKTCIAFDLMSVNIADLGVVPRVLPYLKLLFKNEMIVDESDDVAEHVG